MSKITKKDIKELIDKLKRKQENYNIDILALQERIITNQSLITMLEVLEAK